MLNTSATGWSCTKMHFAFLSLLHFLPFVFSLHSWLCHFFILFYSCCRLTFALKYLKWVCWRCSTCSNSIQISEGEEVHANCSNNGCHNQHIIKIQFFSLRNFLWLFLRLCCFTLLCRRYILHQDQVEHLSMVPTKVVCDGRAQEKQFSHYVWRYSSIATH